MRDDGVDAGQPVGIKGRTIGWVGRPTALRRALQSDRQCRELRSPSRCDAHRNGQRRHGSIGDRGPGIAAELREQVFIPFFRLETSRNRETGGVGLGLAVARTTIRRHGGDITLTDRPVVVCW
ncbi:MAG: ATP-binding protein [Candidatus Competibacteraceae bacterium]